MPKNYAKMVGEQLRKVRLQKGLSLQEVESKSRKRFKASIVGAYERGERNVSVPRLYEMAKFYEAPVDFFLVQKGKKSNEAWASRGQIQINLEALDTLGKREKAPLIEYLELIRFQRGDFNEKVISIREEDLRAIACLYHTTPATLSDKWSEMGLIAA
ncbi:MAG: transcriptional regulator [Terriglobia bacterium]